MEVVTERLLYEERKIKDRDSSNSKAMAVYRPKTKKPFNCYHCGKPGHIRRNCRARIAEEKKARSRQNDQKQKGNTVALEDDS